MRFVFDKKKGINKNNIRIVVRVRSTWNISSTTSKLLHVAVVVTNAEKRFSSSPSEMKSILFCTKDVSVKRIKLKDKISKEMK